MNHPICLREILLLHQFYPGLLLTLLTCSKTFLQTNISTGYASIITSPPTGCPTQVRILPCFRSLYISTSLYDNHTLPLLQIAAQLPHLPTSQLKGKSIPFFLAACKMVSGYWTGKWYSFSLYFRVTSCGSLSGGSAFFTTRSLVLKFSFLIC